MATSAGGLPYVETSDLVSGYPAVSELLAETLDSKLAALTAGQSAWTAFNTTVSGTGWAIGNAQQSSAYTVIGKVCHFRIAITWGSTSTYGTGPLLLSLPVAPERALALFPGWHYAGGFIPLNMLANNNQNVAVVTSTFASATATVPITFAVGQLTVFSGTYQAL
jgi:hypothetical protein